MMMTRFAPSSLLVTAMILSVFVASAIEEEKPDCSGGACPNPTTMEYPDCGMWLGPSPIKEAEEHGFGLGVFTGKAIPKGAPVEQELLVPVFDSLMHDDDRHPPLREYMWLGTNMPEVTLETRRGTFAFMPGLASIAPCTEKNYNLILTGKGDFVNTPRDNIIPDSGGIHRGSSPMAGAFSYRHNVTYTAVRDIVVGEELTVYCDDDDFDGGAYFLSKFLKNDNSFVCVDNIRADTSVVGGQGVFAKRRLFKDSVITSTPVVPIDHKELEMKPRKKGDDQHQQLLLNYCYGHPRSDVLVLPFGPSVNYINHPPEGKTANAIIRWHQVTDKNSNDVLPRRQQYHHPELLEESAKKVTTTHGKGLMMDIVALREIRRGEEIYIDYGTDWVEAHKAHVNQWKPTDADRHYVSAADYSRTHDLSVIRTVREQETNPYPKNLETVCFWDEDDNEDELDADVYFWSEIEDDDQCLRPCIILDRFKHDGENEELYMAKMLPIDSSEVIGLCTLDFPETVTNIPRRAIRLIDRPYTSDTFMKKAFRHEIGVPDGFFPETWMKKKLRGQAQDDKGILEGEEFKRRFN